MSQIADIVTTVQNDAAAAIARGQQQLDAANAANATLTADNTAKDTQIATLQQQVADLTTQAAEAADVPAAVTSLQSVSTELEGAFPLPQTPAPAETPPAEPAAQ